MKYRRPDFIGIGAMKSATTWMWHQIAAHPDAKLPLPKEHHYFDQLNVTPEQYLFRFGPMGKNLTGEITPAYMTIPHAPLLARAIAPEAKIIAILRNPVDRAFSHWKVALWREAKIPPNADFRKSFDLNYPYQGGDWHSIKEKGMYLKYLKRWYHVYPEDSVGVFWYDDMLENPTGFIGKIYEFLGLRTNFVPNTLHKKYNSGISDKKTVLSEEDRAYVLDFYMDSIERLEDFTGRDLSKWKQ